MQPLCLLGLFFRLFCNGTIVSIFCDFHEVIQQYSQKVPIQVHMGVELSALDQYHAPRQSRKDVFVHQRFISISPVAVL